MSPVYTTEIRESILVFTIQREESANALTREVLMGLGATARDVATNEEIRGMLVTGAGSKYFCAGADLKERRGWTEDDVREQLRLYRSELGALDDCSKPVIAAVNGLAFGGGLEIALACDLRVASSNARFALPETGLAVIPGAGGTQRLPRLIGESRAKEMILLRRPIDAKTAWAWGLVNHVVEDSLTLLEQVIRWVEPLRSAGPLAIGAALRAVDAASHAINDGLEVERSEYESLLGSMDRLEGLRAFAEKRSPTYRGQ